MRSWEFLSEFLIKLNNPRININGTRIIAIVTGMFFGILPKMSIGAFVFCSLATVVGCVFSLLIVPSSFMVLFFSFVETSFLTSFWATFSTALVSFFTCFSTLGCSDFFNEVGTMLFNSFNVFFSTAVSFLLIAGFGSVFVICFVMLFFVDAIFSTTFWAYTISAAVCVC